MKNDGNIGMISNKAAELAVLNGIVFMRSSIKLVPGAGLEPAQSCDREILSLLCLPIPPPGLTGVFFIVGMVALLRLIQITIL